MKTYIYLASPYTARAPDKSLDEELMTARYIRTLKCYSHLLKSGLVVFCPIVMTHEADKHMGRASPEFWYEFNKPFLQHMSAIFVLKLAGWEESEGVKKETGIALSRQVPIFYLEDV